ncbi:unnamed protein product [Arabis nemorensis]|uniref:Uncharacterized protein n=1 Tax=Arabis nemorensis TaxID=586526 RepID=A0A565BV52_9BRAS|nr:unnamed protein product [Arabis nemorensis]
MVVTEVSPTVGVKHKVELSSEDFTTNDDEGFVDSSQGGVTSQAMTESGTSSQGGVSPQLIDSDGDELEVESPDLKSLKSVVEGPSQSEQDRQKRVIKKPVRYIETCFGFALTLEDLSIDDIFTKEGAVAFALAAAGKPSGLVAGGVKHKRIHRRS